MVSKKHSLLLFFLLLTAQNYAQELITYVTLNKSEAYIGEPVQMSISVYSSTWFTSGINIGNIQVEGALTTYFRSVTQSKQFSGKNFAGVEFIYNLFPTKAGEVTIPAMPIHVESPKPGGYQGIKHTIHTKVKKLTVKDIPLGYDPNNWLVSRSLNVSEKWNTSLKKIKVGDVLQRTITRSAAGTLAEFIPEVRWDSVAGVSIYPKRPTIHTNKSKTSVSSDREESVNYLFEKEGDITLPKIEFVYWNYITNQFYKKVIDSINIHVAANPDLKMLATMKKKLSEASEAENAPADKPFLILGMTVKQFIKVLLLTLLGLWLLFIAIKWLVKYFQKRHQTYVHSELFAFHKVTQALHKKDVTSFFSLIPQWVQKLALEKDTFDYFIAHYGTQNFITAYNNLKSAKFNTAKTQISYAVLLKELKLSRENYIKQKNNAKVKQKINVSMDWLNPKS